MPSKLNIHMHSVLSAHGGAARVLNLLAEGLLKKGHTVTSSCELEDHNNRLPYKIETAETATAETTAGETATAATKTFPTKILPAQLAKLVQSNQSRICHLHSTQNWGLACGSLACGSLGCDSLACGSLACGSLAWGSLAFTGLPNTGLPKPVLSNIDRANINRPSKALPSAFAGALAQKNTPVCITLHDCSLLTGGCINPLDCVGWRDGCLDPCPLKFANAPQVQAEKRKALQALRPALAAPSVWLCRMVKELGLPCKHIPNGVEANPLNPALCRASLGVSAQARMVLFVAHGGLQALGKGAGSWMRIWQSIKSQIPQAICFMVGGEDVKKESDLVHWPYVDRSTMQKLLAAADLLVYPSLADNHPLLVLEAMSAATPVCAYAVGGVPEQIRVEQNKTGMLVKCGDEAALGAAALKILSNSSLAREMGINAKNAFERHFRAEQMVDKYVTFYQGISKA